MTEEHSAAEDRTAAEQHSSHGPRWGTLLRNTLLGLVVLGMVWLVFNVKLPSIDELQERLVGWGGAAWIVFVALYAVVAITPIPVTIMAVTAGILFGIVEGSILSVIGALIGCWIAYWLARGLGTATVKRLLGRHATTVEKHLEDSGLSAVFVLRLMPGLPYWPVNYGSGAFGVSQRDYLIASGVATIPGQVSLVAIGAFIAEPSIAHAAVVVAAWLTVAVMTILALRRWRRSAKSKRD
ncbi:TVP38/TMEM64 family protein [uncultured Agrococcus sp.]|uniref:TVP38/TMEM64 family protein n=1 Tax=uncultured Agrococcus sp. TaxID=382258 RepID=UPI0025DA2A24|nr:TVP38/TMEM64 family protein [uncultured Agrococcus sp.]